MRVSPRTLSRTLLLLLVLIMVQIGCATPSNKASAADENKGGSKQASRRGAPDVRPLKAAVGGPFVHLISAHVLEPTPAASD